MACRVMSKPYPGPWTFRYHPWLKEMHDSEAEMNVGQKAAQLGFTEAVLNITFKTIDVDRTDCLYVLPAKTPDASDFSASRFDAALELSPHLLNLFSDVKNVGHKRAGTTNLYIRGSKSRAGLKSIPVGFLVLDEVDEMEQDNIPLAMERQSGQVQKRAWAISTPTISNRGINALFRQTTQEHFFFNCPCCSRFTELTFPECLEVTAVELSDDTITDSYIKCKECKNKLPHELKPEWLEKAIWVPGYSNRDSRGFYVNQMYSSTVSPVDLAKSYIKAQMNPADEQEFYNSKMGLDHTSDGARITDHQISQATKGYKRKGAFKPGLITMGVDVGKWLHYEIDWWQIPDQVISDLSLESKPIVLDMDKVRSFEELDLLMKQYRIAFCIIDANPERRKAFEFASRFWGHVKMCFYGRGIQGKQIHIGSEETNEPTITVDRTSWLDLSLSKLRTGNIEIPIDTPEEWKQHLKALVRIYEKDPDGNPIARYVKGNDEDHYAHARNYAEIALPFALNLNQVQTITRSVI